MKALFKKKKDKAQAAVLGRGPVAPAPVVTDHEGASSDVRCASAMLRKCSSRRVALCRLAAPCAMLLQHAQCK